VQQPDLRGIEADPGVSRDADAWYEIRTEEFRKHVGKAGLLGDAGRRAASREVVDSGETVAPGDDERG
jgi:hypothetical protein